MGHVISIPGLDDEDDTFAIATSPVTKYSYQDFLGLYPKSDGQSGNLKKTFLRLHTPDRHQKCILDNNEVKAALEQQAEEILQQQGLFEEEQELTYPWTDPKDEPDDTDAVSKHGAVSVYTGFMSDLAPSEMTTNTNATRPVKNGTNRLSGKRKWKTTCTLNKLDGAQRPPIHITESNHRCPQTPCRPLRNDKAVESRNKVTTFKLFEDYAGVFTACIHPKDDFQASRTAYSSVLYLKMKAHLASFYIPKYLRMFPHAPAPPGLHFPRPGDPIPSLVSEGSDTSSSSCSVDSHGIDFGSIPPSTPVLSAVSSNVFMDLAITGSLGLVPRQGHGAQKGKKQTRHHHKSPDHYIVLMNRRSGVPLAVCALKSAEDLPVVRIYATKQRVATQQRAATTHQLGLDWCPNLPLFAWAEIATEGMFPDPNRYSIYMASGVEGRFASIPSYEAFVAAENGAPIIQVEGRTDKENLRSGCALIAIEVDEECMNDDLNFHIDIAQGIDPALLVCFTAVIDEVMEKNMRLHCKQEGRQRLSKLRHHTQSVANSRAASITKASF